MRSETIDNDGYQTLSLMDRRRLVPPEVDRQGAARATRSRGTLLADLRTLVVPALVHRHVARRGVPGRTQTDLVDLAPVESFLLGEVMLLTTQVFALELNVSRVCGRLQGATPALRYIDWLGAAVDDAYLDYVLDKYEALESRLERLVSGALRLVRSINAATVRDERALVSEFGLAPSTGIRAIIPAGDAHGDGQRASVVVFADGARVMFKPRSDAPDRAFSSFLDALPERVKEFVRVPRTLPSDGYHWQEWVERDDSLPTFRAAGHWLAIAHLTGTRDLHHENLLPVAGALWAVDLECAFNALPKMADDEDLGPEWDLLSGSSILPVRVGGSEEAAGANWGVVGALHQDLTGMPYWAVEDDATDVLRLRRRFGDESDDRQVAAEAELLREGDTVGQGFVDGVSAVEEFLTGTDVGTIVGYAASTRVLLRPTQTYADVLGRTLHPAALLTDAEHVRLITEGLESVTTSDRLRRLSSSEAASLHRGEVPIYTAGVGADSLTVAGEHVPLSSVTDVVRRRAEAMRLGTAQRDLRLELDTIRKQIAAFLMVPDGTAASPAPDGGGSAGPSGAARALLGATVWRPGPLWVNVNRAADNRWVVGTGGANLYQGSAGVLVALSAAARAGIDVPARHLDELVADVERAVDDTRLGIGVFSGRAGMPFALAAAHSDGHADRDRVRSASDRVAERLLEADADEESWDLISGWAGVSCVYAELVRTGLVEPSLGRAVLERSITVLEALDETPDAPTARWIDPMCEDWLGGLSHGVAGVAVAASRTSPHLAAPERGQRLASRAWRTQLGLARTGGDGALSWEDRRPARLRGDGSMQAWCHGTEGIALAAVEVANTLGEAAGDVSAIQASVHALPFTPANPSLCHGTAGRLIALERATSGRRTATEHGGLDRVLDQVRRDGADVPELGRRAPESWNEGLMVGRAGVLWALVAHGEIERFTDPLSLRLALPSVPGVNTVTRHSILTGMRG